MNVRIAVQDGPVSPGRGSGKEDAGGRQGGGTDPDEIGGPVRDADGPEFSAMGDPPAGTSPRDSKEDVDISVGNPSVETIHGVLRLFRPVKSLDTDTMGPRSDGEDQSRRARLPDEGSRSSVLCLLSVPEYLTPAETFRFLGAFLQCMSRIRFVRHENKVGAYSCIVEFRNQSDADDFYLEYDGKRFCSLEEDICRAVYVESLTLEEDSESIPSTCGTETEVPSCPVCLERLDAHISGVATTVCNHDFHPECLGQCSTTSCPVCRYVSQVPQPPSTACQQCQRDWEEGAEPASDGQGNEGAGDASGGGDPPDGLDLWICIICGHVGCGRYFKGHARKHWEESSHCYAMELQTQRVWDYVGDGYVHRLIRSKAADGHLVEVPSPGDVSGIPAGHHSKDPYNDAMLSSKLEAISFEYNNLLTAQLDSQRQYFEDKLARMQSERDDLVSAALTRAKQAEKKAAASEDALREGRQEATFLKNLNETLLRDKKGWQDRLAAAEAEASRALASKEAELRDLKEQLRDVMVYLEAQTLASECADIKEGTVVALDEDSNGGPSSLTRGGRDATHERLKNKVKMKKTNSNR